MKAEIQCGSGDFPTFGEAVHDPPCFAGTLFRHEPQGIWRRITGMDHQWQGAAPRYTDMNPEAIALPLRRILVPKVIQPRFTDGDYLRVGGKRNQLVFGRLLRIRVFGMHADAGKETIVTFGQCQHARQVFQVDGNAHGGSHAVGRHSRKNIRQAAGKDLQNPDGNANRPASMWECAEKSRWARGYGSGGWIA
jgi:hypothetical protein